MKSMTGYGKGSASEGLKEVTLELRCVNNRYLEISTKLYKNFLPIDEYLRGVIPKTIKRGTVDVFFSYVNLKSEECLDADLPLIKQYFLLAEKIYAETGVPNDLKFTTLLKDNNLITKKIKEDDVIELLRLTARAAEDAVSSLERMRILEGEAIKTDLQKLTNHLLKCVTLVTERAPMVIKEYRDKLTARITESLSGIEIDQNKLINEVAFFVDKSDVNEELQRLNSHLSQFLAALNSDGEVGRKLDFICQEIGREINTLGSKSNDITLTGYVVEMKNTLEKIKEQIRNVE